MSIKVTKSTTADDLKGAKVEDLKALLKKGGKPVGGNKGALIDRILELRDEMVAAKEGAGKAEAKPAPDEAADAGTTRAKSIAPTDGTKKDEFTGEVLPLKAFPTMKDKDGAFTLRGPVARKNLAAWRAAKKKERDAAKAKADKAKAAKS